MSNISRIAVGLIIIAAIFGGAYLSLPKSGHTVDYTLALQALDGSTVTLADQKGKTVFVNFFATWCSPCRAEFPEISKLHTKYASRGIKIISISIDDKKDFSKVESFASGQNARQLVLFGENAQQLASQFGVSGIPANFLLGADGKVLKSWEGYSPSEIPEWESAIEMALGGPGSSR